jgi:hypothetical protein
MGNSRSDAFKKLSVPLFNPCTLRQSFALTIVRVPSFRTTPGLKLARTGVGDKARRQKSPFPQLPSKQFRFGLLFIAFCHRASSFRPIASRYNQI